MFQKSWQIVGKISADFFLNYPLPIKEVNSSGKYLIQDSSLGCISKDIKYTYRQYEYNII